VPWCRNSAVEPSRVGGLLLLAACDGRAGRDHPTVVVRPVRVETVRLEPAETAVRYAAVLRPRIEADVGFRVGGKLVARLVEVGFRVEPGMALARLDPADLELQARATEAQLAAARADAANAAADYRRYAALRRGEWTTQQEHDRRQAVTETAAARVRQLEAELKVARNQRAICRPGGRCAGRRHGPCWPSPARSSNPGQAVFKIARLGEIEAVAAIPEQQIGALSGSDMAVELWALPGARLVGRLRELAPMADGATRTYQARVTCWIRRRPRSSA